MTQQPLIPQTPDLPTALKLLGLTAIPKNFETLASRVAWTHPASEAMSVAQSLAYRVIWEAVEQRIENGASADT